MRDRIEEFETLKENFFINIEKEVEAIRNMSLEDMSSMSGRASVELLRAESGISFLLLVMFLKAE